MATKPAARPAMSARRGAGRFMSGMELSLARETCSREAGFGPREVGGFSADRLLASTATTQLWDAPLVGAVAAIISTIGRTQTHRAQSLALYRRDVTAMNTLCNAFWGGRNRMNTPLRFGFWRRIKLSLPRRQGHTRPRLRCTL